jgi:hypothetical protein
MDDLDDIFASAREGAMQPSQGLMARVLADAEAEQARNLRPVTVPVKAAGFWMQLAGVFGGAGPLAGIGTAALAGLFVGFVQPQAVTTMAGYWQTGSSSSETVELIPDVDAFVAGE